MTEIRIVDTTLRDGHQCLWATRMSTPMMLPVIERMDRIGFEAVEVIGAVHFDTCVRYIKENPWERLRALRDGFAGTSRQVIIRSKCALRFQLEPDDISRLWVERLIANGVQRVVGFDGLHDIDNLEDSLLHAKRLGARTLGWLIFSESPIHTDELYRQKAREFLDRTGVDELMIEDTSGILTPERVRTLVPTLKREIGDVRLGLHTHNLAGLSQRTCIEAAKLGVETLYTCIAPIADGNAPPAVQTMVRNLRHLGFTVNLDDALIDEVAGYFDALAEHTGKPRGRPQDFDAAVFDHQIPGGVLSNLVAQLEAAGIGDKIGAVLAECGRVRAELGWPIQVTPFSQFVGVQATLNVIEGKRYSRVPDEVKKYALGYYGRLLSPVDPGVLDRIVENGSKRIALDPPRREPALPALRQRFPNASEEELLLRHSFQGSLVDDMLTASPDGADFSILDKPLLFLIKEISERPGLGQVFIQKDGLSLRMKGGPATGGPA